MRKIILLAITLFTLSSLSAQDFSNKGKDFWVAYGYHQVMGPTGAGANSQDMVLYFATDQVTNIVISIPSIGFTQNLTSGAGNNVLTSFTIPKNFPTDARIFTEGQSDKGIHITSDKPMVAYAHIYNQSVSGATILYPTNTLGREYYSVNYKNWSNTTNANCWFYVVATDTGTTTIKITPTNNTEGGWIGGTTYTVNLTQGQVYFVKAATVVNSACGGNPPQQPCQTWDLTGSLIQSINNGSGCKKIAVFSGSGRISISCDNFASSSDNYMVQAMPKTAWGKKYLTAPANGNQANNIFRVCVSSPAAVVRINGAVTTLPLINNFYYEIPSTNQPQLIESDSVIMVAQYFTSQNECGNGNPGDPEVIYLSAVEQNINKVLWNATPNWAISTHSFNVVLPNTGTAVSSFRLDGAAVSGWVTHPQEPNFVYLRQNVSPGPHVIQSDSGFNAIAYGFGNAESYGYNAGTNIRDLYQQIGVQTTYGIETTPSVCTNSPFKFKVSLPYIPDSMRWNFNGAIGMLPNNNTVFVDNTGNIAEDSTTVVNGRTLHWYSIPLQYTFTTVGVYPITITTYVPNAECGSVQDIDFDLNVSDPPIASFTTALPGCYTDPVTATETTPQVPKATYKIWWEFYDPVTNTATVYQTTPSNAYRTVSHTFTTPGVKTIRHASITTPGCLSDTLVQNITLPDLPNATISGNTAVCLNSTPEPQVTFTGSLGTAEYIFSYNINGGATIVTPPSTSNVFTINAPTNVAGTFVYNLIGVRNASPASTLCTRTITGQSITVTVNPLPAAAISGGTTVCLNAAQPPVTFTGSGATAPYTFNYTINGTPQTPLVSNAAGVATINAPTNVAGTFVYTITSVTDGSSTVCSSTTNVSTTIIVNDLPDAAISGATAVCLNAAQPPVTFTGSGGTAPYTFNYTINGVAQPPLVSNATGVATINAPTNVAGTFTYALVSVQEGSPIACLRTGLTGTTVITVNPLPTGVISGATEVCRNAPSPLVTFTGSGATAPYTFSYTINGTPQTPVVSNAAGIATVPVSTAVAGTFTYVLTNVQDASSTTCNQVITGQQTVVTVNQLPTANFNFTAPSCETRTISFTDLSVPNSGTLNGWTWDFGDGSPLETTQNPTHVYASAGTYTVRLTVTTDKGCTSDPIASIPITINNRPQAGFIIPEVCLSDTYAQFIDTSRIASGAITAWAWNFGDPGSGPNNTSNLQNPTHSYTAVGNYNVELIVTSALGCKDTIVQVLTVNGSFPVANFNVQNPATLCANDSVSIVEASTVFPGVITKIEIYWDNVNFPAVFETDNSPFTGKVYRHLYPNFQTPLTKVFTIRYRAYSGGVCVNDELDNITVNAAPLVQFNNMPDTCLLASPFQITQASEIGGVPGTGVFSGPGVSPSGIFNPMAAGIGLHTILYTFTSTAGGCVDTMSNTIRVLDTAHAAFTFVSPSCEQTPTSFTDLSTWPPTVTPGTTVWDFGDGSPVENHAPGSTFGHTFPAPGTYTVTMYNVSAYGCNSTVTSQQVTVDPNHTITLTSGSDNQTVCINTPITNIVYTLAGGATGASVTGLPPGVTATVTGNILTISGTPNSTVGGPAFTYTVLTTGNSCVIADTTGIITVEPDHTIAFASGDTTQSVCVNSPIDPIVYTLGGGASNVTINNLPPGVVYNVVGNTLTISGTPTSTAGGPLFAYSIQTTGNSCIVATALGEISVNPYPVPNFAPDKTSYCIPNAIVIFNNLSTMPDGSGMTYAWDFGEPSSPNNTSTAFSPSHWYSSEGPFNVNLSVRSTAVLNGNVIGCVHDTTILLNTIHPQPKADFVFNKPGVCIGDNVIITDNTDGKDGVVTQWNWDMGDGTTRNINPVTYTYGDTISYNITLYTINSHGCNSDTVTKPYRVYPYPHVNAGPDRYVLEGGSIQLETVTYAIDPQYTWTPNLYLSDARIARPRVVDPKTDMTYRLTVTNNGGCSLSDDVFVKLLKFPVIPNTFTPNNDGINDTWRIDFLNTYPNNRVQIFTRAGNLVFESRGYDKPWDGTMKGKPMPFDTYYYIIEPGNGRDPITGYVTIIK
jgi:gliding motility-associated-like protein